MIRWPDPLQKVPCLGLEAPGRRRGLHRDKHWTPGREPESATSAKPAFNDCWRKWAFTQTPLLFSGGNLILHPTITLGGSSHSVYSDVVQMETAYHYTDFCIIFVSFFFFLKKRTWELVSFPAGHWLPDYQFAPCLLPVVLKPLIPWVTAWPQVDAGIYTKVTFSVSPFYSSNKHTVVGVSLLMTTELVNSGRTSHAGGGIGHFWEHKPLLWATSVRGRGILCPGLCIWMKFASIQWKKTKELNEPLRPKTVRLGCPSVPFMYSPKRNMSPVWVPRPVA